MRKPLSAIKHKMVFLQAARAMEQWRRMSTWLSHPFTTVDKSMPLPNSKEKGVLKVSIHGCSMCFGHVLRRHIKVERAWWKQSCTPQGLEVKERRKKGRQLPQFPVG